MFISFQPSGQQKQSQQCVVEDVIGTEWNPTTLGTEGIGIHTRGGVERRGANRRPEGAMRPSADTGNHT